MKLKHRFLCFVSCLLATGLFLPPTSHCNSTNNQQLTHNQDSIGRGESFKRGLSALKENRLEAALVELSAAEHEEPNDPRVHNFRGIVLARLGQSTEAAAEYQEAIRLDPLMEDAYRNLGYLEWTEHNLGRAREALVRAVGLSPKDSFAHYYLGRVQLDGQVYAEAFRELELSGVPWPAEPGFLIEAAEGYLALGRQEEARKTLHQLASLPLLDAQSVRVASLLLAVHENDSAIGLLRDLSNRQAAAFAPWAQFDLALTYLLAGRYQEAADHAQHVITALRSAGSESRRSERRTSRRDTTRKRKLFFGISRSQEIRCRRVTLDWLKCCCAWVELKKLPLSSLPPSKSWGQYFSSAIFEACPSTAQAKGGRQSPHFRKHCDSTRAALKRTWNWERLSWQWGE